VHNFFAQLVAVHRRVIVDDNPIFNAFFAEFFDVAKNGLDAAERKYESEANEARRKAIRDLLYRGDG